VLSWAWSCQAPFYVVSLTQESERFLYLLLQGMETYNIITMKYKYYHIEIQLDWNRSICFICFSCIGIWTLITVAFAGYENIQYYHIECCGVTLCTVY